MMCVGRVHNVVSIVSFDGAAVRSQCYQLACRTFAMHILSRELHNSIRGEVRLSAHVSAFLETSVLATSESGTGVLHVLLVQPRLGFVGGMLLVWRAQEPTNACRHISRWNTMQRGSQLCTRPFETRVSGHGG